ncbi:hypothetical protein NG895_04495 [Aeoliella sp. ICT_H6.2]|uniref:Uncharacterized protein n=1 Tax=Aeoliella straminimaris TaxID=2954799 RepID=A0A9X2F6J7_9BACT|nr:hypothetical protein [Aeoliella straminimaris]MCO6043155.1 hypothetical protein [Aeoliella straminimaris]
MDCDQVFMVLTSGPFPTGDPSDVDVEEHLERCPECWRFAEALRPAHDVFEEAVPASEGRDLPGYWGDAIPARAAIAQVQQTALQTASRERSPRPAQAMYYTPIVAHATAGWHDVARIAVITVGIIAVAGILAWTLN